MMIEAAGQQAASEIGIDWRSVPADGRWHETPAEGKSSRNGAGRIRLFPDGDGGICWNHLSGDSRLFWAQDDTELNPAEREARKRRSDEARREAEAERRRLAAEAATRAAELWKAGGPATGNPYLQRKGVKSCDTLRQIDAEKAARLIGYLPKSKGEPMTGSLLLVPVMTEGRLSSVQLIGGDGVKHFLKGGQIRGGYWATGKLPDNDDGLTVAIAEGVATALSISEATGWPVAAALSCGNLPAVADDLRSRYPKARLVVCSDKGNGEADARKAAAEAGAILAVPAIEGPDTDFNDLATAKGLEEVKRQLEAATETEKKTPPRLHVITVAELLKLDLPPRGTILAPWLPAQGLCMVYAPRGVGKTHFSLGVSYAVASGGSFLTWEAPSPRGVLFIDGEMPTTVLRERLARIALSSEREPTSPLKILTPDLQDGGMIDLSRPEDQIDLEPFLSGVGLIVVDNLSTLCRSGRENEGEGWLPVQEWALRQRAAGRSVLFIHHAGKGGQQRGTSRREDVLDTVISLRRPGDYSSDQGAIFEVHFEKARGLYGDETKTFEAKLTTTPDGRQEWTVKPVEESTVEKVAALLNEGVPQVEIAEMLGVTKGAVSKAKQKAGGLGFLAAAHN